MKVAILDWPTTVAHESFAVFHRSLARSLTSLGHQAEIFHDLTRLEAAHRDVHWDCTLAIGSHYRFDDGTRPLYERLALPHFQWLVDTPFKANLPVGDQSRLHTLVIDEEFVSASNLKTTRPFFLPLGTDLSVGLPAAQRCFDIVFTGQIKDPNHDWASVNRLPPRSRELAQRLVDQLVAAPDQSLLQLYDQEAPAFAVPAPLATQAFLAANSYLRSWKRQRVLQSIRHLPVHVFGEVRDPMLLAADNLHCHAAFPYAKLKDILAQSRIALNITPNFYAACHDRIIASLACTTLAATDTNPYLDGQFANNLNVLTYRYNELHALEPRLESVLRSGAWESMAEAGRQVVEDKFSWKKVAEKLILHMQHVAGRKTQLSHS